MYIPVAPKRLKRACEIEGCSVVDENEESWLIEPRSGGDPFCLPKNGPRVTPEPFTEAAQRVPGLIRQLTSENGVQQAPREGRPARPKKGAPDPKPPKE